ncbi:MAG TPA: type II toxin-antitoxin system VapC family toxin [Spirochaetota bacterium]|jgi:PIN domain nuclease of toxin-antitoxin system|nr:MAG: PIN domain protein [Spirochaetes bacterium ADurb.Bin133]HNZ26546.1 type II toxin-antitoxin system VapC family toxin [Spirochaetota bacterium]HPY86953.1 type II toxin-antitoxin system VapC family toxin [Spirochaetota bacterium]
MKYLLDTHIFLWYIGNDSKLDEEISKIITDFDNEIYLSVISAWELIIKSTIGKFKTEENIVDFIVKNCKRHSIRLLDLTIDDLQKLDDIPLIHKDPFDRALLIQSVNRGISLLTDDYYLKQYNKL